MISASNNIIYQFKQSSLSSFVRAFLFTFVFTLFISQISVVSAQSPFGAVAPPPGVSRYGSVENGGLLKFTTVILRTMLVIGGIYSLINFILAGFQYMSAANDPKALQAAWAKIWQTILGLVIAFGSFLIAAIVGYLITGNVLFILQPTLYSP